MLTLLFWISLAGQTPGAPGNDKAAKDIPDDFKIVAEYKAGYSDWSWWNTTITADGESTQEIPHSRKPPQKEAKLSSDDIKQLLAAIKEAEFSKLPKTTGAFGVTDEDTMILEITADGKKHRVYIYGYRLLKDKKENKEDMKRFAKVWREVLKKVPSPNADQKPELYEK